MARSPMGAAKDAAREARARTKLRKEVREELYEEIEAKVRVEVREQLEREVRDEIATKIRDEQASGPVVQAHLDNANELLQGIQLDAEAHVVASTREAQALVVPLRSSKRVRNFLEVFLYLTGIPLSITLLVVLHTGFLSIAFLVPMVIWYYGVQAVSESNEKHFAAMQQDIEHAEEVARSYRALSNRAAAIRAELPSLPNTARLKARLRTVTSERARITQWANAGLRGLDQARSEVRDRMLGEADLDRILAIPTDHRQRVAPLPNYDEQAEAEAEVEEALRGRA
jgi:hypothetical protein